LKLAVILGLGCLAWVAAWSVGADPERPAADPPAAKEAAPPAAEAPAAFDNKTNGFEGQDAFNKDRKEFEKVEKIKDGLGPVYNATSCVGCHQNPVTGSSSQIAEIRSGHQEPDPDRPGRVKFVPSPGGSLIHQRAIDPAIQEHVLPGEPVRTLRMSTNILGNGFVEMIPDEELLDYQRKQEQFGLRGFAAVVQAPVKPKDDGSGEFEFADRIGRFGWKCQQASLLGFAADAYVNEMGITSPLQPNENQSNGRDVSGFDKVKDPEDKTVDEEGEQHVFGADVEKFTRFMRATKAPPRASGPTTDPYVAAGEKLFRDNDALGCAVCHRPDYTTPPKGTKIHVFKAPDKRGSDLETVPEALANKTIHPFSDFLLHDIGTGDGVTQTQHAQFPPRGADRPGNTERIPKEVFGDFPGLLRLRTVREPHRGNRQVIVDDTPKDGPLEQRAVNMIRTAPLWGLRVRPQLMHDGRSLTIEDAIRRHQGRATAVTLKFEALSAEQKRRLLAFLNSL
jgi:CxxC motif-containing protein (DUF1111 family)